MKINVKSSLRVLFASVIMMLGICIEGQAQTTKSVTGVVTDNLGEALPGVNVAVKGTTTGIITDLDGNYALQCPNNATLVFSFIGYKTQEIPVGKQSVINVQMVEDTQNIEEVVVVGYGTQKKVNLTGAVAAVKVDEKLSGRSLSNVSSGLQGLVPGLQVTNTTGMAGKDNASLMVRGLGTVNGTTPLVVVDGMPDVDINRINFQDIESISVLKDAASASVYGSRASNGVILITTKNGAGSDRTQINFSASLALSNPIKTYDFMDDYARALNMHQIAASSGTKAESYTFKNGTIDQWMAMSMIDPLRFPDTDVWETITRTGALQNYNVSASGGSDKSNFFISLGMMDQRGVQVGNDYRRYNTRVNVDHKILPTVKVGARIDANWSEFEYSGSADGFSNNNTSDSGGGDFQYAISGVTPYDPVSGRYGGVMAYGEDLQAYNPYASFVNEGNPHQSQQNVNGNMYIDWNVIKGLTAHVDYSLTYLNYFSKSAKIPTGWAYNFQTGTDIGRAYVADNVSVSDNTKTNFKTQLNARLNYNVTLWQDHDFGFMFNYSEEYWHGRSNSASRNDRLHYTISEIDGALTNTITNGGTSWSEGLQSYVGRFNYTGWDKYLLEFNFRVDGSSKFAKGARYGFFPSLALGWRFTQEEFVQKLTESWLNSGKLRVSYGETGNNSGVGYFDQQETLAAHNYVTGKDGSEVVKGFVNSKMINKDLSWETTKTWNVGLDLSFVGGKLSTEIDYYNRLTTGMLRPSELSMHISGALDAPDKNIGDLRNRGVELNLTWQDRIGEFQYSVNLNGAYNRTTLEKWNEYLNRGWVFLEMPYHFLYAYQDLGMAQTWEQIYQVTPQGAVPGQYLFEDLNGNGMIDGADQKAYTNIQRDRPTTTYGLTLSASWKGFDIMALFNGTFGRKDYWQTNFNQPSPSNARYNFTWSHQNNAWSLENRDTDWQKMGAGYLQSGGTYRLYNMSYLRLKNLQLGYNFPKKWISKVYMNSLRLYASCENLFTITQYPGLDPEKSNSARDLYPINRTFSLGVNVGF